jgi:hypothetical protein
MLHLHLFQLKALVLSNSPLTQTQGPMSLLQQVTSNNARRQLFLCSSQDAVEQPAPGWASCCHCLEQLRKRMRHLCTKAQQRLIDDVLIHVWAARAIMWSAAARRTTSVSRPLSHGNGLCVENFAPKVGRHLFGSMLEL